MISAVDTPTRDDKPNSFKRMKYDSTTKQMLINYMESINPNSAAGYVEDFVAGRITTIPDVGYEDDQYYWSSQDIYYLKKYNIAVESHFIDHVNKKIKMAG